jgi:hypothetical protein
VAQNVETDGELLVECSTDSPPPLESWKTPQSLFGIFTERPFVRDDRPGLFFCEHAALDKTRHTGARAAVLDDPEQLTVISFFVELAVSEIAGPRRQ